MIESGIRIQDRSDIVATKRVLDTKSRKWKKVSDTKKDDSNKKTEDNSGLASSKSGKKTATSKATKRANRKTLYSLEGNLSYVPNENSIQLRAGETVKLKGLGSYLSGNYYVSSIERTISSSGYSQTATVLKTDFKKSLKIVAKYPDEKSKLKDYDSIYKKNLNKYMSTHKGAKPKKHVVKKGDTLYSISKKYFKTTKYAKKLASINGNLAKSKWKKLPVSYKLVIAKK